MSNVLYCSTTRHQRQPFPNIMYIEVESISLNNLIPSASCLAKPHVSNYVRLYTFASVLFRISRLTRGHTCEDTCAAGILQC